VAAELQLQPPTQPIMERQTPEVEAQAPVDLPADLELLEL
jgi:hypothetical protein